MNKTLEKVEKENTNPADFERLRAKIKANIESDSFSGHGTVSLKIKNDSIIWGSVTAFIGIEIARFFIDSDEVVFIDKYHGRYYRYPLSIVESKFGIKGVDFRFIQNLITGNELFNLQGFTQIEDPDDLVWYYPDTDMSKTVYVDKKTYRIKKYEFKNEILARHLIITYRDRLNEKNFSVPKEIEINLLSPYKIKILFTFTSLNINQPFEIDTEIPRSYEKGN